MSNLNNEELDAAIAGYLWNRMQQDRDNSSIRQAFGTQKERPDITPVFIAEEFGVSQQRTFASLTRLKERNIVIQEQKYNKRRERVANVYRINEEVLLRVLLSEAKRWMIHENRLKKEVATA